MRKTNKQKVSKVARNQYRQLCKKSSSKPESIDYKIKRAVDLGKKTHRYKNGCKVIRYHYLNFLVSNNEIMTIWKDKTAKPYHVTERKKQKHKDKYYVA